MIEITIIDDLGRKQKLCFDAPRVRIGRDADNDVVLDSDAASRHHAEIVHQAGAYKIIDLGSTNGIKIGDTRVPDLFLVDGMSVVLGAHTLTFSIPDAAGQKTVLLGSEVLPPAAPEEPERPAEPAAIYLVFRRHGQQQSLKAVAGARYAIGRSPEADLILDDNKVSKRHALVYHERARFRLRDLESSNGTLLNGRRISDEPLAAGDEIFIGGQVIVVQDQRLDLEDDAALLSRTRLSSTPSFDLGDRTLRAPPPRERENGSRLGPKLLVASVVLAVLAAFLVLRELPREQPEAGREVSPEPAVEVGSEPLIVRVAAVETKDLERSVDGSGIVRPHREVTVSAEIAGRIRAIAVDEGSPVGPGELLARLDETDIRLQLDEARSAVSRDRVDLAREDWERARRLFDEGVVSQAVVDQSQSRYLDLDSAYQSAEARIRQLEEQLRKARIGAPISGRVAKRFVNEGEVVAPGGPVVTLENMQEVLVELEVSDRDIVKVEAGQTVEATTDAFPDRVFRGIVESTATAASPVTRTFKVEARFDNRDGSLRSGMIASLRILLEESRALVIPIEALIGPETAEPAVFVVTDGLARRRSVGLGERWDREVEVLTGLADGDEVIVSGQERLEDGQQVEISR